jgi:hypothetical protein
MGLMILGLIVGLSILGTGCYWYYRRQQQLWRVALREVARIESLLISSSPEQCYQALSLTLRNYYFKAQKCASDVTDVELFDLLMKEVPDHSAALLDTIEHIKKVKFAHQTLKQETILTDLVRLKVFIEQTQYL